MDEAKPFLIPKREVWEAFKRVKANQGAAGVDGQSIEDFEANLSGNLSSGIECPQGATSPRRCGVSTFRKQVVVSGRWAFQRSLTALLRKSLADIWSRSWSRSFIRTPLAIGPANLRLMPWRKPASAAGATTGCSISTSRALLLPAPRRGGLRRGLVPCRRKLSPARGSAAPPS